MNDERHRRTSGVPTALTRRRLLGVGGGLAAGAVLAACGGRDQPGPQRVAASSPRVAAVEKARATTGRTVEVQLEAAPSEVDLGGVTVSTWTYGGQLPGKEIRVRRGDLLRLDLRNGLPQPTTIHWHGVALRNDMDGAPDVTQPPIAPGSAFRYEFVVPDAGTYWFHPHSVQLDRGLYAPLIVEDPEDGADYDTEVVVVLDDWLDGLGQDPDAVLAGLRGGGMSHGGAHGDGGMSSAMPKSDVLFGDAGDVRYPHVLANGRLATAPQVIAARPGQRVRLRIINAAADTAFRVGMPGARLTVTHTDGFPVAPKQADMVLVGMGERIDALVELPASTTPLVAIAEGRDTAAQVIFRTGAGGGPDLTALLPRLATLPVLESSATDAAQQVALETRTPDAVHELSLEGPEPGYRWTINGKEHDLSGAYQVREGQLVRLRFANTTTMFHPMHLHGHTFQVRGAGGRGPRKDTVNVMPGTAVEVDFQATNPGQWMVHCHNAYHADAGMMTVLSYVE